MLSNLIDIERLIHSLKTAIACGIAFLFSKLFNFAGSQWIVITTIVIMCAQIYVGSVIQKAYLRFLGTLVGCLFAIAALEAFGDSGLTIGGAIVLSSFIFSYIATGKESYGYAGTLGAVTTAIIMLGDNPTIGIAALRFCEISVGILIATTISQYVLPIHAHTHVRRTQAATLTQLRDYYTACLLSPDANADSDQSQELDETIIKSLSKERQLAKEAAREPAGSLYDPDQFIKTLFCEKEILRSVDFMFHALVLVQNMAIKNDPNLKIFNESVLQALNTLIKHIDSNLTVATDHIHIPSLQAMKTSFLAISAGDTPDEKIYVNGFLFAAEILTAWLEELAKLYRIPSYK